MAIHLLCRITQQLVMGGLWENGAFHLPISRLKDRQNCYKLGHVVYVHLVSVFCHFLSLCGRFVSLLLILGGGIVLCVCVFCFLIFCFVSSCCCFQALCGHFMPLLVCHLFMVSASLLTSNVNAHLIQKLWAWGRRHLFEIFLICTVNLWLYKWQRWQFL